VEHYRREPFGFPAADMLNANNSWVIAASAGNKDLSPNDFLLGENLRDATLTEAEQQAEAIERLFAGNMIILGPDGKPAR
jgi:hypothetical protein